VKKFLAVPAIAILAAAGAASAANFANGTSAGPIQSGDATDLTCAESARVIEWGTNDHTNPPYVDSALIELTDANCGGQALHVITLTPAGTQQHRATSGRIAIQPAGPQRARVSFPAGDQPTVSELNAVRITIDPGYAGLSTILPAS
jgi:hypothetical protein